VQHDYPGWTFEASPRPGDWTAAHRTEPRTHVIATGDNQVTGLRILLDRIGRGEIPL